MTKWIVSTPLKGTNLMKNFVCFTEVELRELLEQYPDASVEMKDSHLEDHAPLPLADDQQVVLDYLKSRYHDRAFPFDLVGGLNSRFFSGPDWETDKVLKAYGGLNSRQQFQVLAAFAEWGIAGD